MLLALASDVGAPSMRPLLPGEGMSLAAVSTGRVFAEQRVWPTHPDGAVRRRAVEDPDGTAELGAPGVNISRVRGMVRDGDSTVTAEGRCFEGISTSADLLASLGITIVLEPGNRQDRGCVNSVLSEGIDVFRRLGRRYLKLMPEISHMNS